MATFFGQTCIMTGTSVIQPTKCLDFILPGRTQATLKLRAARWCLTGVHRQTRRLGLRDPLKSLEVHQNGFWLQGKTLEGTGARLAPYYPS